MSLYAISTGGAGSRGGGAEEGNYAKVIDQAFLEAVLADGPPGSAWGSIDGAIRAENRYEVMLVLVPRIRQVVRHSGFRVVDEPTFVGGSFAHPTWNRVPPWELRRVPKEVAYAIIDTSLRVGVPVAEEELAVVLMRLDRSGEAYT